MDDMFARIGLALSHLLNQSTVHGPPKDEVARLAKELQDFEGSINVVINERIAAAVEAAQGRMQSIIDLNFSKLATALEEAEIAFEPVTPPPPEPLPVPADPVAVEPPPAPTTGNIPHVPEEPDPVPMPETVEPLPVDMTPELPVDSATGTVGAGSDSFAEVEAAAADQGLGDDTLTAAELPAEVEVGTAELPAGDSGEVTSVLTNPAQPEEAEAQAPIEGDQGISTGDPADAEA